jgi:hypothetical protein
MHSLPVSTSDFPWWGWLLWAVGCWTLAAISMLKLKAYLGGMREVVAFLSTAAGFYFLVMGIARFFNVGWMW